MKIGVIGAGGIASTVVPTIQQVEGAEVLAVMDTLRRQWGLVYPMEK